MPINLIQNHKYLLNANYKCTYLTVPKGEVIELLAINLHTFQFKVVSTGETFFLFECELNMFLKPIPLTDEDIQSLIAY